MTTISPPVEFAPILPIGFHRLELGELRCLCVERFPTSATRPAIMTGLLEVLGRLHRAGVHVEVWVNGSFMTRKQDPRDVDIVLRVPAELFEKGTDEQRAALQWVEANQKGAHHCDSYLFPVFPPGDEREVLNDYNHAYWIRQFGFSRGQEMKGIAVLHSGEVL